MGMLDDMKDKGESMMQNPDTRAKIEKMAKDKGMSIDEAKEHFMKHGDQGGQSDQNQ